MLNPASIRLDRGPAEPLKVTGADLRPPERGDESPAVRTGQGPAEPLRVTEANRRPPE